MNAEERKNILSGKQPVKRRATANSSDNRGRGKQDDKNQPPPMTFGEHILSWVKTIVSSLLIVMVINGLLIASFVVPTASMENEVMAGDFLFVNKFIYGGSSPQTIPFLNTPLPYFRLPGLRDPERGDVIVFIFPGNRDQVEADEFQYYLKRCVATAGDTLEVKRVASPDGNHQDTAFVFINGVRQPVPRHVNFIDVPVRADDHLATFPENAGFTRDNWGPMRIPKKGDVLPLNDSTFYMYRIFIMREGHQVEKMGEIVTVDGKPATSYTVGRDYCFGMGDNRNNSADSRYWGFVPYENVVGTPLIVYWSWPVEQHGRELTLGEKLGSIRWERIFNGVK
jgi:signal peptidase I